MKSLSLSQISLLSLLLLVQISLHLASPTPTANFTTNRDIDYIKTSCNVTLYKTLCYTSLSIYASKINANPKILANTALNITLIAAKSTSRLMRKTSRIHGLEQRVAAAVADCVEEMDDSVHELQDSIGEMGQIKNSSHFSLLMDDIQTWVSAALTYEETCMDGFEEGGNEAKGAVKNMVRRHIVRVAHLTSNALALINEYASMRAN